MSKFLLDANLSPTTATLLSGTFGVDVVHQRDVLPGSPKDQEIAEFARREHRVIITFDRGFGERYHHTDGLGVIVLRLRNQRRLAVEQVLTRFFGEQATNIVLDTSLVIIDDSGMRVISPN